MSLIGLWWLAVLVFRPPAFMLPGPDRVAAMLWLRLPDLAAATAVTATEMILGLLAGTALGIATALVMAVSAPARKLMMPLVVVAQSLPVFAVAPVLVLWFGFGLTSKVVMATIIIFFPVASAFHDGLSRTDPGLLDLASLYRASPLQRLAHIRLPAAMPSLVSGLRMAAAVAPIGAVIGEWVGASNGLGLVMIHANARLQTDLMFAALVIVAGLAVVLRLAVDRATRRLVPWLPEHD
ncbi:ABC transporter permease [Methyloraptor flagellatus]|uniref:ABC transporter permease n=1 Tax=Methyloraptor flagellatus TaxID=3162530 RepID=A0AAU7XJI0_9HYPH